MRPLLIISACLAFALAGVAAGCGDDDETTTTPPATTTAETGATGEGEDTTGAAAGGGGEAAVSMVTGNQFDPATTPAAAGDTVVWTNDDTIAHNTVADGGEFESPTMEAGDTYEYTVEGASGDTIDYVCTFHPGMEGTIAVD